jgi:hypothetical protein
MHVSRRTAVVALAAAALGGSATAGMSAFGRGNENRGHHRGQPLFASRLAPSVPADPALHGVQAGNVPWVLRRGEVRLKRDGRMRVRIRGLVVPAPTGDGTPSAVTTVSASLFCGDSTTPTGTIGPSPLSKAGNARIAGTLTLPAKCLGPVVLVHPNGNTARYIAASGFGG